MTPLRRRKLLELADQAACDCGSAAGLALALEALEQAGWQVRAAMDDGELAAGQLTERQQRVALVAGREHAGALLERAPTSGGWALMPADGALVLLLTGRRRRLRTDVLDRIRRERAADMSLRAIAAGLERDGVPAPRGGTRWDHSTVRHLLKR